MKKLIIAFATLIAANFAMAASGDDIGKDFTIVNNTDISSTVKLLSGMFNGYCATEIPFGSDAFTTPHSQKTFDWRTIKLICSNSFPCEAEIYVGNSVSCQANQGDKSIGKALLQSNGDVILKEITSPDYDIQVNGSTITLNQK